MSTRSGDGGGGGGGAADADDDVAAYLRSIAAAVGDAVDTTTPAAAAATAAAREQGPRKQDAAAAAAAAAVEAAAAATPGGDGGGDDNNGSTHTVDKLRTTVQSEHIVVQRYAVTVRAEHYNRQTLEATLGVLAKLSWAAAAPQQRPILYASVAVPPPSPPRGDSKSPGTMRVEWATAQAERTVRDTVAGSAVQSLRSYAQSHTQSHGTLRHVFWQLLRLQVRMSEAAVDTTTMLQFTTSQLCVAAATEARMVFGGSGADAWTFTVGPPQSKEMRYHPQLDMEPVFASTAQVYFDEQRLIATHRLSARATHGATATAASVPRSGAAAHVANVYPFHLPLEVIGAFFAGATGGLSFARKDATDAWAIAHSVLELATAHYAHPDYVAAGNAPALHGAGGSLSPYAIVDVCARADDLLLDTYYADMGALIAQRESALRAAARDVPGASHFFLDTYAHIFASAAAAAAGSTTGDDSSESIAIGRLYFTVACNHVALLLALADALGNDPFAHTSTQRDPFHTVLRKHEPTLRAFWARTLYATAADAARYDKAADAARAVLADAATTTAGGGGGGAVDAAVPSVFATTAADMLSRTPSAYTPYVDMLRFRFGAANNATLLLRSLMHIDPARRQQLPGRDATATTAPAHMLKHAYFAPMHIDYAGIVGKVLVPQTRHLRLLSAPRIAVAADGNKDDTQDPAVTPRTDDELRVLAAQRWPVRARFVHIARARPDTLAAHPELRKYAEM